MNILMTGGLGFIGSHLRKYFEKAGHCVKFVDTRSGHDIYSSDIAKLQFDLCIHLESMCIVRECINNPLMAHHRNATYTANLLEYCVQRGIKKFIYFSSSRVLFPELNPYTVSKRYCELLCKSYQQCFGIDYKIIRPSTVYGPGDRSNRVVNKMIKQAINKEPIVIYGDTTKSLDMTYISDFVRAFDLIFKSSEWNTEYNVSNNQEVNLNSLAEFISLNINNAGIINEEAEKGQPQNVKVSNTKLKELGYAQIFSWEEGITETINWIYDTYYGGRK